MKPSLFNLPFDSFRSDGVDQKGAIIKLLQVETPVMSLVAPPGSGKTVISLAYGQVQGRTLFLTPTKHLHTQLEEYGVFSLHGHSHYSCWKSGECVDPNNCEYARKMKLARSKDRVGTTYANWIGLNRRSVDSLGKFDLIVCDEAHNLPWILADQIGFNLSADMCDGFEPATDAIGSVQKFVKGLLPKLAESKNHYKERQAIETFLADISLSKDWLCQVDKKGNLTCRVIWSNRYTRHVFVDCKKVLLMSATLSYQTLNYLGIPLEDNTFVELPTNFDPRLNPFIVIPTVPVQYNMTQEDCNRLVKFIDEVIESRKTQGVIHSVSYEYARIILERSMYSSVMISHTSSGAITEAIERFLKKEKRVFVSPSLSEGVSLEDDFCRWQVPLKIPTLNKMDDLLGIRCSQDRLYEPYVMANTIQQQHGRGRRNIKDYCESLMPDIHWQKFYKRNRRFFMRWFHDTVKVTGILPQALKPRGERRNSVTKE